MLVFSVFHFQPNIVDYLRKMRFCMHNQYSIANGLNSLGATCMCVVIISRGFHHMIEKCVDAIKCLCNRMLFIIEDDTCVANEFRNSIALYAHRRFSCTTKIALSQCLLSSASIHSFSIHSFFFV